MSLRMRVLGLPVRVVIPSAGADERAAAVAEAVLDSLAVERWAVQRRHGHDQRSGRHRHCSRRSTAAGRCRLVLAGGAATLPLRAEGDPGSSTSMLATGESVITLRVDDAGVPGEPAVRGRGDPGRHARLRRPATRDVAPRAAGARRHGNAASARALARAELDPEGRRSTRPTSSGR